MSIFANKNQNVSRNLDGSGDHFVALPSSKKYQNFTINSASFHDLLAILLSIILASLAYGILIVMIAIRLEANVKNEILISLSTVTQIGAGVIFSNFLPSLEQKIGAIKSIFVGSIITAICTLLLFKYISYWLWLGVIYVIGSALFTTAVTRSTIMIDLTPPKMRSIIISLGSTLVAIGNAMGPIILNITKTKDSFYSFLLASILFILSALPLLRIKGADSILREQKKIGVWRYIKNSPKIFCSGFTFSFIMSSCSTFSIIYGIKNGMTAEQAPMLLSSLLLGTVFYMPLGFLCNYFNRRFIIILSALSSLYLIHLIKNFGDNENIFLLFFLLFGIMSGMKLPTIVLINEKYKPTQRLIVNSAFSRVSLIGNICGIFITGILMKEFQHHGLWISCSTILTCFIIFWFLNYIYKIFRNEFSYKDLAILYKPNNDIEQQKM